MLLNPILFSMPFLFFYDSFDLAHSMPSNCFCDSIKGASWGHDSCVGTLSIISYYFCFTLLTCQMYLFYSFAAGIKKKKPHRTWSEGGSLLLLDKFSGCLLCIKLHFIFRQLSSKDHTTAVFYKGWQWISVFVEACCWKPSKSTFPL